MAHATAFVETLNGEAGLVALVWAAAAGLSYAAGRWAASGAGKGKKKGGKKPQLAKEQLLQILESSRVNAGKCLAQVKSAVATAERMRELAARQGGGAPPTSTLEAGETVFERAMTELDTALLKAMGVAPAAVQAALTYYSGDAEVAAAVEAVRCAHPLIIPADKMLRMHEEVVRREIELQGKAVADAKEAGIPVDSGSFHALLSALFREAGGATLKGEPSMVPAVLGEAGYGDRIELWTQIVSKCLQEEKARGENKLQRAFFEPLERQRRALISWGLNLQ